MVDAAPAAAFRKRRPGGPWVAVRAHYGALPSVAGRGRRRAGESLPGWRACSRLCRKYGPGVEEVAAAERREALPCASVSRRSGKYAAACYSAPFGVPLPPFYRRGTLNLPFT